ncbi:LytTR family DNA-binding domain-containing protein [Runella sp. SP2]|uniref:LytTR family DNA-binding domain-containing protein n=1 Tax=Runella sp. SP2 TaxID=2268026 RepID=UPI000F077CD2|nr:LytTR family DNA-binding domain-containing protein [Runella sp. SP2]AYQ34060.1 LytTR family transcriptional regulator [Runella sp. SP2]
MARRIFVPIAAFVASHLVFTKSFPWQAGYFFPWPYFLTVATVMLSCWEINLRLFWWLDASHPFYINPLKRIVRQLAFNGSATLLTFILVFPLAQRVYVGRWPAFSLLFTGTIVCFTIAIIVNGAYISLYLLRTIYWQNTNFSTENGKSVFPEKLLEVSQKWLILIATPHGQLMLQPVDIAYFYSSGGVILLVKADGSKHTTSYASLVVLSEQLGVYTCFFVISRQFIVCVNAIKAVKEEANRKLTVSLVPALRQADATEEVVVSRYRSGEFKKWLAKAVST